MTIEEKIFKNHIINKEKLVNYGFIQKRGKLIFEKVLSKAAFSTIIEYSNNNFKGKIFDLSTNYEYTNFRLENSNGFSSEIREEFINLLIDIKDNCTENKVFQSFQGEKINHYIKNKYNNEPEFLWKNLPTYAIFRNKDNHKWYAIIGTVPLNKVDLKSNSTNIVEIINVKVDKNEIDELLKHNGIYQAYHMNKKHWITIILDDTLKTSEIEKLVDKSFNNIL